MDDCELRRVVELFEYWSRDLRAEDDPRPSAKERPEVDEGQMMGMMTFMGQPGSINGEMRENIEWAEKMKAKMRHGAN